MSFTPWPQRVLIVENSRSYAGILAEAVETRLNLPVVLVRTMAEAQTALEQHRDIFLILSGLVLPDAPQDELIDRLSSTGLPLVVVSSKYDEELRDRILGRSVVDYVIKSAPGHLEYLTWLVQRLDRNRRIAALVVDDSPSARLMVAEQLSSYGFQVLLASSGEEGLAAVEQNPGIRLVITDHEMPGMTGVELATKLRERFSRERLAIIGVSGASKPELVARFLKNGANDFLHKPYSREEFFCRVSQNVDNLDLIGALQDLATKDFLTGLSNRRHFFEVTGQRLDAMKRTPQPLAVATIDIDHFKKINDTYGHDGGDIALKAVSRAVTEHARTNDMVARFGGEEFVVFAPGLDAKSGWAYFESLRERIAAIVVELADGQHFQLTTSIGVCISPDGSQNIHALLSDSDRMLYTAKAGGRNQVEMTASENT